jgi:hypothetical protein
MHAPRLIPLLVVLAALVVAPAAAAKEITSVKACGDSGCVTTKDPAILQGLMNGGPPTVPPDAHAPAVRLTATITEPGGDVMGTVQSQWVPSLGLLVAEDGTWMKLPASAERALNALDVRPFPVPGATKPAASPAPAPATAPPATDDGGFPAWLLVVAGLTLAGVLVAAALYAQRPRPHQSVTGRRAASRS